MKRFVFLTNMVISFWNKFHNNGPNEDPWGQPLDHSLQGRSQTSEQDEAIFVGPKARAASGVWCVPP